ncbi:MAG: hypothetical protein JXR80_09825 [Deltaproteobacteria bacterium]|nr:hypothetical protein [Deltaproteobacteria bacterium]
MLVQGTKLRKGLLIYRGVLFDYSNGRTYGPCFTLKLEAIEWAEKEAQKSKYPRDCQKMVMWNTCEDEGEAPEMEGSKADTII